MKGRAVELHRRGASEGAADRDQLGKGELQHRRKLLRDEIATAIEIARQARAYGNAGIYGPFADAFPPMYDQWCRPIIGDASISLQKLIFQIIVAGVSAKHKIWNFIIDEIIKTQYSNSNITMDTAEAIEAAAAILTRVSFEPSGRGSAVARSSVPALTPPAVKSSKAFPTRSAGNFG
jgi:hypothetical protein